MPLGSPKTPCIGFCEIANGLGICYGCGRRMEEISRWVWMDDTERDIIMEKCRERLYKLYGDDLK